MTGRTFLDSIMWHNCHLEGAASSGFIRDMTDQGAEFRTSDWINIWTLMFEWDFSNYNIDLKIAPLPRLTVESMQIVTEFAEGELDPSYQI
jgi:hypothetical protein